MGLGETTIAIDTAAKRKSCIGLALIFLRPGVIPDGSNLSAAQRLHTDLLYAGIAAGAAQTYAFVISFNARLDFTIVDAILSWSGQAENADTWTGQAPLTGDWSGQDEDGGAWS